LLSRIAFLFVVGNSIVRFYQACNKKSFTSRFLGRIYSSISGKTSAASCGFFSSGLRKN